MLNYMKSEWYRQRHNRGLQLTCLVCLALIAAAVGILGYYGREEGFRYGNTKFALGMLYSSMYMIFVLTVVPVSFMENNTKDGRMPMKHSVAFGIARGSIYLGKMAVQFLICTLLYLAFPAVLTGLSYLFLEQSNVGELQVLVHALTGAYPLCVFMLSLCLCFVINMGNNFPCMVAVAVVGFGIPKALQYMGLKIPLLAKAAALCPVNMFEVNYSEGGAIHFFWDSPQGMAVCYIVGLCGAAFFAAVGIVWLKKREIR